MTDIKIEARNGQTIITIPHGVTVESVNQLVAAAKPRRSRKPNNHDMTRVERLVVQQLTVGGRSPKALSRSLGYTIGTIYASVNKLRRLGYDIRKLSGWNGRYVLHGGPNGS